MRILLLFLVMAALPAYAEKIKLDCEHDNGIRRSDGLPSDMEINFFRLEIDLESNQIVFPEGPKELKAKQVSIDDQFISFLMDFNDIGQYQVLSRRYWISRNSGRLYVNQFGIDKDNRPIDVIAAGVCQKPSPIF